MSTLSYPRFNGHEKTYSINLTAGNCMNEGSRVTNDQALSSRIQIVLDNLYEMLHTHIDYQVQYILSINTNPPIQTDLCFNMRDLENDPQITAEDILDKISDICQSGEKITVDILNIKIVYITHPLGHARPLGVNFKFGSEIPRRLVEQPAHDCVFIAIAQSIRYKIVETKGENWMNISNQIKKSKAPPVHALARNIALNANLNPDNCNATRAELKRIDDVISFRLISFYINADGDLDLLYKSSKSHSPNIYILLRENTYYPIPRLNDLIATSYEKKNLWFCQACCRWLTRKERCEHNCVDLCSACYSSECRLLRNEHNDIKKNCHSCKREFFNNFCYNTHVNNKICRFTKKCANCNEIYNGNFSKHQCGVVRCSLCYETYVPLNDVEHICMMSARKEKKTKKVRIYFDYETTNTNTFIPTALTSLKICNDCKDDVKECTSIKCLSCGNADSIKKFVYSSNSQISLSKQFS